MEEILKEFNVVNISDTIKLIDLKDMTKLRTKLKEEGYYKKSFRIK